ncbi:hypothetical protein H0H87_004104 [Tephrocybe sp. NHM501043]|nr:hypothetical protein H0H87_004104 [Tephrocybe sp. NHM501043]
MSIKRGYQVQTRDQPAMHLRPFFVFYLSVLFLNAEARAPAGPWDKFNYAPSSRTVRPKAVYSSYGKVQNPQQLIVSHDGSTILDGHGSYVVLDFGQEVGGVVSLTINEVTQRLSSLSLSFTESSEFISPSQSDDSCHSVPTMDADGVQVLPFPLSRGTFTQTIGEQRGGFKYLTIVSNNDGPVIVSNVSVHTTWMPHWDDLRAYNGYFFAQDSSFHDPDFLTKLWYAGAYTVQTNTIDSHQARQQPCPSPNGKLISMTMMFDGLVDLRSARMGQQRIWWFWDMGISSHTEFVALNDLLPTKNALLVMFSTQDPATGSLQYSGPPINAKGSDTYIGWSLIGTHNYYLYTGDLDFVQQVWGNYTKALAFLEGQVDLTGLMNVPPSFSNDWGRDNGQGYNSAANAILYRALVTAADLAAKLGLGDLADTYSANATALKKVFNTLLWDDGAGMFRDNPSSALHPQDGNALAVLFNITNKQSQSTAISEGLTNFWTDIGPLSPELNDTIIPFVGGFEVQAHFIAGQGERALDLLHRGLKLTSAQGATWSVAPVLSGLDAAEGGFETGLGWFGVKWNIRANLFTLKLDMPKGTQGIVYLPGTGPVQVDGTTTIPLASSVNIRGGQHIMTRAL